MNLHISQPPRLTERCGHPKIQVRFAVIDREAVMAEQVPRSEPVGGKTDTSACTAPIPAKRLLEVYLTSVALLVAARKVVHRPRRTELSRAFEARKCLLEVMFNSGAPIGRAGTRNYRSGLLHLLPGVSGVSHRLCERAVGASICGRICSDDCAVVGSKEAVPL